MKSFLVLGLTLFTFNSFAASTLFCEAEDGTKVTAVESPESKSQIFDVKVSIRGQQEKSYPNAYAAKIEDIGGKVSFMVITDPAEGILVTVKGGTLFDQTGAYEVLSCEIGM